jgi:hypothetical protein
VEGYQQGQEGLVYLLTRIATIERCGLPWVATERNAAVVPNRFTDEIAALDTHVDWEIMRAEIWKDTEDDGSRKQRRMAEFLVHRRVPWEAFSHIATRSDATAERVRALLLPGRRVPKVIVRPGWYF